MRQVRPSHPHMACSFREGRPRQHATSRRAAHRPSHHRPCAVNVYMSRRLFIISSCFVCLPSAVKLQSCCASIRRLARSVSILIFST